MGGSVICGVGAVYCRRGCVGGAGMYTYGFVCRRFLSPDESCLDQ